MSVDGCQQPERIASIFRNKFEMSPRPLPECVLKDLQAKLPTAPRPHDPIRFSYKEVAKVVRRMKHGKSPGHDDLSLEHILCAGDIIYEKLCKLFNLCIRYAYLPPDMIRTVVVPIVKNRKGDLSSSGNYRPISLGTIIGKIFERLLQPELLKAIDIDDAQFGFRPGLSTDSAIVSLKYAVNYYVSNDTSVYACFLDLSRAFDLVNYDVLWNKMRGSGVPEELVRVFEHWYGNQTNFVKWGDATSNNYILECGVRQGGLTSPDLFNLYVNDLMGRLRSTKVGCHIGDVCVNSLSYADDMVLLSPSIKGLRKLVSVCEDYVNSHGLIYNLAKTEIVIFKAGRGPDNVPEVRLNGGAVRVVEQFKYLGHVLTGDMRDDKDMERERRALAVRGNMIARKFARCSREVKCTLFNAYCLSFYTCQLWMRYSRKSYSAIRVQYNNIFRALMGLPRSCSASTMFAEARIPDFFAVLRARISSFWEGLRRTTNTILSAVYGDMGSPIFRYWLSAHQDGNRK